MSKNKAASIRDRLLQLAKAEKSNFDQVLVRFALERSYLAKLNTSLWLLSIIRNYNFYTNY